MALIPDPRGLWVQAFLGMLFVNDNYFYAFFVFLLVHYLIVWQTMGVVGADPLMQWEFIGRMAFIYFWGSLAGITASIALRTRPLIPGYTFFRGNPSLGLFLATSVIFTGIRSVMIFTGQTRVAAPFDPDPADSGTIVLYSFVLGLSIIGFFGVLVLTFLDRPRMGFLSWFAIRYRDGVKNSYIVDYIVALTLVLSPQALWDFLVLPPYNWPQLPAGALTVFVELVAWIIIYLWFTYYRRINGSHFAILKTPSDEKSLVSFGVFCLTAGGIQIINGIYYFIIAEFYTGTMAAEAVLVIFMGVTIVVSFILGRALRRQWNAQNKSTPLVNAKQRSVRSKPRRN